MKNEFSEDLIQPQLRFNSFKDNWNKSKLMDICIIQDGTHSRPNYVEQGIPFFSVETIINNVPPKFISKEEHEKLIKRCCPKKGDILLTRITGGILGYSKLVDWEYEFSIYVSLALLSSIRINPRYLNQYLKTSIYRNDFLSKSLLIATPPKINLNDLSKTKVSYPSFEEQEKIATFLEKIDKKIELLEKKHANYKNYIKSLKLQLFGDGKNTPLFRLSNFDEKWEEKSIEELFDKITDYVAAGSFAELKKNVQYKKEKDYAQLIRTIDLKNEFRNDDFVYVDKKAFEYLWRVNLEEKCIVLPNIGTNIGEIYLVNPQILPYENNVLGPNAILLKSVNEIEFKYHLLNSGYFRYQLNIINESTGAGKFNKTNLKKIKFLVPKSQEERNEIGNFITMLDKKLDLIGNELNIYKDFKKGLLQKMFI